MEVKELLEKILELDENNQAYNLSTQDQTQTFLDIIGRSKDEDLISRMLAYVIKKDKFLFGKLMAFYFKANDETGYAVDEVKCEQVMLNGRADIFITGKDRCGKPCTLTIENKIDTWEHDEQTQTYYEYIRRFYGKGWINAFLFLKPDYNLSQPSCEKFHCITYSELFALIDNNSEDLFIHDFCNHIKNKLSDGDVIFMELDSLVLKHYEQLNRIIGDVSRKFENFKAQLFQEICCDNRVAGLDIKDYIFKRSVNQTYTNKDNNEDSTLRVYVKSDKLQIYRDKWYYKPEALECGYYFYVELKFNDNSPNNIVFQKVGQVEFSV